MASGYRQLMPPQGYSIADLQAAWHQIDTAEGTLRVLIQETLRERAYKERLLATFNRKVGLHRRWLAENAKLALVLCMADRTNLTCTLQRLTSLSNWGADSNILSFLLSEREKLLALQCKHKTMLADADAHNGQRIRGLQELRRQICQLDAEGGQTEESLSRLRRSWTNLTTVLSRRTEFIESSLGMVESIIDVEKVIMQLETSWDRLAERLLRAVDFELQLTEGEKLTLDRMTSGSWQRVGAALRSALSDGTLPPVLPCSVRQKLFTRFLALTLPMESLLSFCECHCRNLNDLKQRASTLTDRVQRTALILRDIDQLNASLSRKESQIARTDYLPNLEHISRQVKLQTEVLTSIRAMSTSISQSLTAAAEAKMQDRIRPKAENLRSRFRQVETKAEGVLASLQFHLLEKEKHQQLESMEEWISERQAVVNAQFVITGTSVKQQKAIQKYHLLRNFEAEVDSYSHLAERIFREAEDVIKLDPANSTSLAQALERNADLWANLKITLSSQGSKLVKIYRAIIFSEGCEELVEWLRKASLKIFSIEQNRHLGQRTTAFGLLIDLNREPRQGAQSYLRSRLTAGLKRSSSDTCVNFLPEKPLDQCGKYDLSNISYALSKVADLNGQLNNKWLFFQELQVHSLKLYVH
ncbi:hypothetical protein SprV_0100035400 [Sparganum proliferum]